MRNLTITRTKSFVASLGTMKVYIEDPLSAEIVINNTPCRKIGTLKNGEQSTFVIDESAARVFVIADKLSKDYCSEFYKIPAGDEDIFLSGKNHFNPASGNAFRFDGVTDEEVLRNRKRGSKKGIVILVIAAIIGFIAGYMITSGGFSAPKVEAKAFSSNGMHITLTNKFVETSIQNYTVCFDSKDVAVFALKEDFNLFDGAENYTLEDYGELVLKSNGFSSDIGLEAYNGLTYFEYIFTNPSTRDEYHYFTVLYKADDAFWMVQFATLEKNFEQYQQSFVDWAKSVEFSK